MADLLHPVKRPAAWATLAPYVAPTGSMHREAIVLRELDLEQRQRPWTLNQARIDLEIVSRYPAPDCMHLRETRRRAHRWGWPIVRVERFDASEAARKVRT